MVVVGFSGGVVLLNVDGGKGTRRGVRPVWLIESGLSDVIVRHRDTRFFF